MKIIKKNYKMILGILVGILLSSIGVYAASSIASNTVKYNNTSSGMSASNVKEAVDKLYAKINQTSVTETNICGSKGDGTQNDWISCTSTGFKVGSYYFCVTNYRGFQKNLSITNATTIYSAEDTSYLDGQYSTFRSFIKANNTSVTFTVQGANGLGTMCYHVLNSV